MSSSSPYLPGRIAGSRARGDPVYVRQVFCGLALTLGLPRPMARSVAAPPPRLAVLSVDLNDLTGHEDPADRPRLAVLTRALRQRFAAACGYSVLALDSATERR